jgi:cystathionine beta-lyase
MADFDRHRADPPPLPAAAGLRGAAAVGVHKASTVIFPTWPRCARATGAQDGYTYGLHGTPTTFTLEERIATLEGGCMRAGAQRPGGHRLVDMALLKQGDEVLLPDNAYGPSKDWPARARALGHHAPLLRPDGRRPLAGRDDRPGHQAGVAGGAGLGDDGVSRPAGLVAAAARAGVLTALDNTWGAGIAFNGPSTGLGVDIVMQALTKYPSGGGDVLMGSVTTRDEALHLNAEDGHMRLGWAWAPTMPSWCCARCPASRCATTRTMRHGARAGGLAGHAARGRAVLHPALPGSPGHAHWKRHLHGRGGAVLGDVRPALRAARRSTAFVDALKLFKIGYSGPARSAWSCPTT